MTVTRGAVPPAAGGTDAAMWSGGGQPAAAPPAGPGGPADPAPTGRRRRGGGRREEAMVPEAHFTSYYGRPVIKAPVWKWDIPAYLFLGGLAGGSSLLAAGADLTGSPELRRAGRGIALAALGGSTVFLIHDLGRPSRFHHMLRVAKPTSPMSMGTWILSAYGPAAGVAAVSELAPLLPRSGVLGLARRLAPGVGRGAGLLSAVFAPALASYTAVLLSDTAVPTWHDSGRQLPFVFVGSAGASGGGFGMIATSVEVAGPARRLAVLGAVVEEAAELVMERRMGLSAEPLHSGRPGQLMTAARWLTIAGGVGAATVARRSRAAAVVSGAALLAGSFATRFGVFYAGIASAKDPKYTVVPQRQRVDEGRPVRADQPRA